MSSVLLRIVSLIVVLLAMSTTQSKASSLDSLEIVKKGTSFFIVHQIERGETLYSLSRRYKSTVVLVQDANPSLKGLKVGQKIFVPYTPPQKFHTVGKGETLYSISKKHSMSVAQLKAMNGIKNNNLTIGQKLKIQSPQPIAQAKPKILPTYDKKDIVHVVKHHETVYSISKKYGVSMEELKKWNSLKGYTLSDGQKLTIKNQSVTQNGKAISTLPAAKGPKMHMFERVVEEGKIRLSDNPVLNAEYAFCLHKTAKKGTVIRLTTAKGKQVWVKVVGTMPESEEGILLINESAKKRLMLTEDSVEGKIQFILS